jgi:signal transduction histidine kinase
MIQPARPICRVLVADDERSVLDAYRAVFGEIAGAPSGSNRMADLEGELFNAQSAAADTMPFFAPVLCRRGEEAVDTIRSARQERIEFPVAFLDVRMPPGIDGIETAARIRALDPSINIVMVTAYADTHPRKIAELVQPFDKLFYINKPFQATEIQQFALALSEKWKAEQQLRKVNQDLMLRCRELEAMHANLCEARERAEAASKAKSIFLANMSHELRTPLNAVIGFADVMRNETFGPIGNDRYREYLDDISRSSEHLLEVINDLLDFSKIEAGKLEVVVEDVGLAELLGSLTSMMRPQADKKAIALQHLAPAEDLHVRADSHRLRQVLLNLLSNAIKFTGRGSVTLSTRILETGELAISVADTGIGMSAENIVAALEPFQQVDQGLARRYEGTGLGLPLARRLSELQGARLALTSEVDKGTDATLIFPRELHFQSKPGDDKNAASA